MHPSRTTRIVSKLIILALLLTGLGLAAGTTAAGPSCGSCFERYDSCIVNLADFPAFCERQLERCLNRCTP